MPASLVLPDRSLDRPHVPCRKLGACLPCLLPFVLKLTAVAAAVLFFFAMMIQVRNQPGSGSETIHADADVWREIYNLDQKGGRDVDLDEDVPPENGETAEDG